MLEVQDILLSYIAIHSITLAMGLFWIYSTQSRVNEEILKRNYKLAEKNSLYSFNEKITNFLKSLIPGYYFVIGLNIIKDSGDYKRTVEKAIASGKYEPIDFENRKKEVIPKITAPEPKVKFELEKEKFKARKNDCSLYDPTETPIEYSKRIMSEDEIKIMPFIDDNSLNQTYQAFNDISVIDENKAQKISNKDIANHISNLKEEDLIVLNEIIQKLLLHKEKEYTRTLEKDVA